MLSVTSAAYSAVHTVQKGDTLWGIAKKYGVSIDDIKRINNVSANKPLKIGLKLTIPSKEEDDNNDNNKNNEEKSDVSLDEKDVRRYGPRIARQYAEAEKQKSTESKADQIVRTALSYRGSRYVRGGTGARGFDCSGFTRHVYAKYGINLPHCSRSQANYGKPVERKDLKPGDLVFFATYRKSISHVGLYIGDGKFIHASTPRKGVIVSSLNESYYAARYRGARRLNLE